MKSFNTSILKEAMELLEQATQMTQERGVRVGDIIAHPTDPNTWMVVAIKDGLAIVRRAKRAKSILVYRKFPVKELFDLEILYHLASEYDGVDQCPACEIAAHDGSQDFEVDESSIPDGAPVN
ncbi:MAG: hypothetical protein COV10_01000 [Candidatus Vogelbacteria bacterium CG10_big_fil_rev_8_21_14_0_10_51_16]|uniref:Uncharacterized protein n=1 Tax=Candidatus Vogelbacteria bacterium CG10_big_fil_rev_8_21_14_0_10_51_16 TaxID=1975045 RepID=A0A2H0RF07_9BACT|nr:MAG: hypothetical protein COV10_01000 [Candidatus Vogelbacteria bacterium CG10_big_fil_rev_8_21_14_0_10_51_16]